MTQVPEWVIKWLKDLIALDVIAGLGMDLRRI